LVVRPHYRVYAAGSFADQLAGMIRNCKSVYPTYLGSAFCLTFPRWVAANESMPQTPVRPVACASVVPAPAARLVVEAGGACARVGGVSLDHLGPFADRRFRGTTAVFYEPDGRPLTVEPAPAEEGSFWEFHQLPGEGLVCLW
jgi:CRISPR-associated protein Cas5h